MILVFAGAGASIAVNQAMYPTTREFFRTLPDSITSSPLFQQAVSFLSKSGIEPIDIEHVLGVLDEFAQFADAASNRDAFAGHLITSGYLPALPGGATVHQATIVLAQTANAARSLRDQINERVFRMYGQLPHGLDLQRTWFRLLQPVHSHCRGNRSTLSNPRVA